MILRNHTRGFTLVEMMIVLSIIAILAAVAIPIYQNYVLRTRMTEVMLALSSCRTTISDAYLSGGAAPGAGNWGCEKSGGMNRQVSVLTTDANGTIIATAQNFSHADIDGKAVTLRPMINASPASSAADMGLAINGWRCGNAADGTTIPAQYLPASCIGQ